MKAGWVKIAFLAMFLWWAYLFFATQFVVVFDSEDYEAMGRTLAHQGWVEFFKTGPHREPMFPWLISISMRLGDWGGISYHYPLKMTGLLFLLLTVVSSYRLMRMLGISRWIALLSVFYLGISPTMTTSSLRLWSEFAAYPWVVLAVIWTIKSWNFLDKAPDDNRAIFKIAGHAAMVASMFLLVMSVKAIAEGVLLLYLWPFYWLIFSRWRSGNFMQARKAALFCLVVLAIFEGVVGVYKSCNEHYNGHFAFTNRGDWALYGNTARRMKPLTLRHLGAAVAFVPGMGICPALFGTDDCEFWSARYSDDLIQDKRTELEAHGMTEDAISRYFIFDSLKMILSNPPQAVLLMFIEAHEMFFWEPSVSFLACPDWLEKIYYSPLFYNVTMAIVSFFTWAGFVFAFFYLCRRYVKPVLLNKEQDGALLWVINFIFWYAGLYSLYFILDRYSFPLASLYVVLMAFMAHQITKVFTINRGQPPIDKGDGHIYKINVSVTFMYVTFMTFMIIVGALWFWVAPTGFKSFWGRNPVVVEMTNENRLADVKSKLMSISYYYPTFPYFAAIVTGSQPPTEDRMDGYYSGMPYIFNTYYQKAVDLFPQVDAAHYLLGFCEYYRKKTEAARAQYEKSIELNPYFFWSYYDLGIIYFQQGDYYKSAVELNKALTLGQAGTLEILRQSPFYAQIWRNMTDPEKALEGNLSQGQIDAAFLMAVSFVKAGAFDQALQVIQRVGRASPWHKELWEMLYQKASSGQKATGDIDRLIQAQIPIRLF